MLLFLATNIVNLINLCFSIMIVKAVALDLLGMFSTLIALQLVVFLILNGEQNSICSLISKKRTNWLIGIGRYKNILFDGAAALFYGLAFYFYTFSKSSDHQLIALSMFVVSLIVSKNLMQFRGVLLGAKENLRFSLSLVFENLSKFLAVSSALVFSSGLEHLIVALSIAPVFAWTLLRLHAGFGYVTHHLPELAKTNFFNSFLSVQILFFATFDVPYVILSLVVRDESAAAELAFLAIFSKIIFFGCASFSLSLIARYSEASSEKINLKTYFSSVASILLISVGVLCIILVYPRELINFFAQSDYLPLGKLLWVSVLNASVFTILFVSLNVLCSLKLSGTREITLLVLALSFCMSLPLGFQLISYETFSILHFVVFSVATIAVYKKLTSVSDRTLQSVKQVM